MRVYGDDAGHLSGVRLLADSWEDYRKFYEDMVNETGLPLETVILFHIARSLAQIEMRFPRPGSEEAEILRGMFRLMKDEIEDRSDPWA